MADTIINARVDPAVKAQAESLFNDLGLTMSAAINLFLRRSISEQGIPFAISRYSTETIQAMNDTDNGVGLSKVYHSAGDMLSDILDGDANA